MIEHIKKIVIFGVLPLLLVLLAVWAFCETAGSDNYNYQGYIVAMRKSEEGTVITYEMLEKFGVDSVILTKNGELDYSIDFAEIGTYEKFYGEED